MAAIPFPISSAPGRRGDESGGRLVNAFVEEQAGEPRGRMMWRRVPGLRRAVEITAHAGARGHVTIGSTLLHVLEDRVYAIVKTGTVYLATNIGPLDGSEPVTIARNNASPTPNVVCTTRSGTFNLFAGSAPTIFADPDLPAANSVSFLDGYFLWTTAAGQIWASGLNNVSVASNSFATAEARADGLLRGVAFRGEFLAFGAASIEVWANAGTSPFPLARRTVIPRGLVGTHAVAGWEEGWSNELLWVAEDDRVYSLSGYQPLRVSTHDVERSIGAVADKSALVADVYMSGGHALWSLTAPGLWTWEFNLTTKAWHERRSYGWRDWRGRRTVFAFGNWHVGDAATGNLWIIGDKEEREGNDPLVWQVESGAVANFPGRAAFPRVDFDFTTGVGSAPGADPIETEPRVSISWSDDGGQTWGSPVLRPLGGQGKTATGVTVLRSGACKGKGRRFRLSVSDPVPVGFVGGTVAEEGRAAQ